MRYTEVELRGFKRMALNNISRFVMRPTEKIQSILGTNGSGKTSLMAELSPMPADPKDYTKEGSKTISISHHGNNYVLKSWFSPSNKHSFKLVVPGTDYEEELNPGGTGTVQKQLIWQHFKYTDEIHDLLRGKERFTEMSPSRRREWYTKLSDANYDYALSVFAKLKESHRDTVGALKLAKKRLVTETEKIITVEEENKLREDVKKLEAELAEYQAIRAPVTKSPEQCVADYRQAGEVLRRMSQSLFAKRQQLLEYAEYGDLASIEVQISEIKQDSAVLQTRINEAAKQHGEYDKTLQVLKKTGEEGVSALVARKTGYQQEIEQLSKKIKLNLDMKQPSVLLSTVNAVKDSLLECVQDLPSNEEGIYGQSTWSSLQEKYTLLLGEHESSKALLARMAAALEHMEQHGQGDEVDCPKCSHRWIPGFSPERLVNAREKTAAQSELVGRQDDELKAIRERICAQDKYREQLGKLYRLMKSWPVLDSFWNYIKSEELIVKAPRSIMVQFSFFEHDLGVACQLEQFMKSIEDTDALISQAEEVGDTQMTDVLEYIGELDELMEKLTFQLRENDHLLSTLNNARSFITSVNTLAENISQALEGMEKGAGELTEMVYRNMVNQYIQTLQIKLGKKSEVLSAVKIQRAVVGELSADIARLTVEEEAYKLLVRELSPTDGLIADGLLGFIRNFTAQMNNLIRKFWTYPLLIQPCGVTTDRGAELDYKFPMMVQTKDNITPDVSQGSTAQRAIVDMAFKIIAAAHLGLADSPLLLDEFSAEFDKEHRVMASHVIKSLMEQQPFSQLFMISHYESSYGSFSNVETCVIDPRNISVPRTYNQHVIIE